MEKKRSRRNRKTDRRGDRITKKEAAVTTACFVTAALIIVGVSGGIHMKRVKEEKAVIKQEGSEKKEQEAEFTSQEDVLEVKTEEKEWEKLKFIDAQGRQHEMKVNPNIKSHDYDWSYLVNAEGEIQYTGDKRYLVRKGVDVSAHQGEIDWQRVKAAGYDFAFLRIGYREYGTKGLLHVDEAFHTNIVNAQKADIDVGVYLFSQAVNEEETMEEVQLVLDNLAEYKLELPVVYDPERIRDDEARTDDVTGEQFTRNTVLFCEKIKEAGYEPMIYSNLVWEAFEYDMEKLEDYPIWYADYESTPQTPYDFIFWQYSESGQVDGIAGGVDLNIEFMSKE